MTPAAAPPIADTGSGTDVDVDVSELARVAHRVRRHIVDMCAGPEGGHLGGSSSSTEILTALYFAVLDIDPAQPDRPDRDRFVLSKGHAALGLYAVLAERGFLSTAELADFGRPGSRLMGHPVKAVPGVELPTGSLGHGLALGCGLALAQRDEGSAARSFVLMGDGELQEGSVWESAIVAASLGLDHLVAVVDVNGLQLTGATAGIAPTLDLAARWRSFGWAVRETDGHDLAALVRHLSEAPWQLGQPSVLICRTVKGRGVPFLANRAASHFVQLNPRNHARARAALHLPPEVTP